MRSSDILRNEHKLIDRMILVVEKGITLVGDGNRLPVDFFDRTADFFSKYVVSFHFDKEEELLFSEMEKAGIDIEELPIEVFRHEHRIQQEVLRQVNLGLDERGRKVVSGKEDFLDRLRIFIHLLKKHSVREDRVLYPMCDRLIGERSDRKLLDYYMRIGEKFGGYQEKYEELVSDYEKLF
jgi:hemerythrin-like domain-containing protein